MMRNKILTKYILIAIIFLIGCSSLTSISSDEKITDKEGICILSFEFLNTVTVKGLSFDIVGNNETSEIDISKNDDNVFFFKLKKGYYQLENIKGTAYEGGNSARTATHFITGKKLYFEVIPGKINYFGHITIKEAYSSINSNLKMRGKSGSAYLMLEITFNQRIWKIFKNKYPNVAEKFDLKRNFISFSKPKIVSKVVFKRRAGLYRGRSGVEYRMNMPRVRKILKQENRNFDVISTTQIIETTKENSIIKYIFSDNNNNYRWRGRLYRIIEVSNESESKIKTKLNKNYKKVGKNKWINNFDTVYLKKRSNGKIEVIFTAQKYKNK